jgi:hypothetical protein
MADLVDIAGENDFSAECVASRKKQTEVVRGHCLFCNEPMKAAKDGKIHLYCDDDCREDYEYESTIRSNQRRSL